jgi:hypothetical protein
MISLVFPTIERLLDQRVRTGLIFSDWLQLCNALESNTIRWCIKKLQKKHHAYSCIIAIFLTQSVPSKPSNHYEHSKHSKPSKDSKHSEQSKNSKPFNDSKPSIASKPSNNSKPSKLFQFFKNSKHSKPSFSPEYSHVSVLVRLLLLYAFPSIPLNFFSLVHFVL